MCRAGKLSRHWKANVKSVKASEDGIAANDTFMLRYSNGQGMPISKAELVAYLTDEEASSLVDQ